MVCGFKIDRLAPGMTAIIYERLIRLSAFLDGQTEFGSGGMMRQSRVLASLARTNDPAMKAASEQAAARIRQRLGSAADRSYGANQNRIARYQARLGLRLD